MMTSATLHKTDARNARANSGPADHFLKASAIIWFLTAAVGQWIFTYYVAAQYIPILAIDGLPGLENSALPDGYVPGDLAGNVAIAAHVLIAIIIIGGGPLQLTPWVRNNFPAFHRYLGRTYLTLAALTSFAGLWLVWTRGTVGGLVGYIAISLDAVLIMIFGAITVWFAVRRQIDKHRRWAMRLFMVVSAVWFFRIGIMFWFMATGGIGIDPETFEGPALSVLYFAQMAIPLGVLQIYFNAQDSRSSGFKGATAVLVLGATAVTVVGTFGAAMGMWFPRL